MVNQLPTLEQYSRARLGAIPWTSKPLRSKTGGILKVVGSSPTPIVFSFFVFFFFALLGTCDLNIRFSREVVVGGDEVVSVSMTA